MASSTSVAPHGGEPSPPSTATFGGSSEGDDAAPAAPAPLEPGAPVSQPATAGLGPVPEPSSPEVVDVASESVTEIIVRTPRSRSKSRSPPRSASNLPSGASTPTARRDLAEAVRRELSRLAGGDQDSGARAACNTDNTYIEPCGYSAAVN